MREQKLTQKEIGLLKAMTKEQIKEKREEDIEEAREYRDKLKVKISDIRYNLKEYKNTKITYDTPRPVIWWPDGSNIMLGACGYLPQNAGGFIDLGFNGYRDFYSLPMDNRNKFLAEGLKIFTKIFGKSNIKITGVETEEIENKNKKLQKELKNLAKKYKKFKEKK